MGCKAPPPRKVFTAMASMLTRSYQENIIKSLAPLIIVIEKHQYLEMFFLSQLSALAGYWFSEVTYFL